MLKRNYARQPVVAGQFYPADPVVLRQSKGSESCHFSVSNAEMQDLTLARFRASLYAVEIESLVRYVC